MIAELIHILGKARVLTEKEDMVPYSFDATAVLRQIPAAVVFPSTAQEVSAVLKVAARHKAPIVARGAGTGLSGGSVPSPGSIVLCLARMDKVLEVDARNFTLRAQAGALTQAIADAADAAGLFYPPDPGSMKVSTIGGNVAENAGGLHGLKYGVTGDFVLGLEVVLANGDICRLGNKCVKDVAGYDLVSLFVGSEGTLGIVTEVLLSLLPKPAARRTLLATFSRMDAAAEAVSAILAAGIVPCTMEFMDTLTLTCVEAHTPVGLPLGAGALLLVEVDGHPAAADDEAAQVAEFCRRFGAATVRLAADQAEADLIMSARRGTFTALTKRRPTAILEDATVPRSELAEMIRFIQKTAARHRVAIATFGHFGDGNLHPTFLTDERDADEMLRVNAAREEIFARALSLGGTITGEHGVGLSKKAYLGKQLGPAALGVLKGVKRSLDPDNLLNPSKIFDC